jgi:hypothetical protein
LVQQHQLPQITELITELCGQQVRQQPTWGYCLIAESSLQFLCQLRAKTSILTDHQEVANSPTVLNMQKIIDQVQLWHINFNN